MLTDLKRRVKKRQNVEIESPASSGNRGNYMAIWWLRLASA